MVNCLKESLLDRVRIIFALRATVVPPPLPLPWEPTPWAPPCYGS